MKQIGKVWLLGAGPSDPELLTLKGKRVLEQAQVVIYDKLVGAGILSMLPPAAQRIDVGKTAGRLSVSKEEIPSSSEGAERNWNCCHSMKFPLRWCRVLLPQ